MPSIILNFEVDKSKYTDSKYVNIWVETAGESLGWEISRTLDFTRKKLQIIFIRDFEKNIKSFQIKIVGISEDDFKNNASSQTLNDLVNDLLQVNKRIDYIKFHGITFDSETVKNDSPAFFKKYPVVTYKKDIEEKLEEIILYLINK